jgi:tetratricopeptide (TPR) repeat protein
LCYGFSRLWQRLSDMTIRTSLLLVWALLLPGQVLAHAGTHEQVAQANRKIQESPQSQHLYLQRGIIYSHGGQLDEAIADFKHAATLGDPVLVSHEMGVTYYRKGDFEKAQFYFAEYLERFPGHAPSYEYRARVYRDMGQLALAVQAMQQYFSLAEHPNPGNYIAASDMLLALDENSSEQALAVLDDGIERLGLVPQLQRHAIVLETGRGNYGAALVRLRSLEQVLRGSVQWQVDMAELLILDGRYEEAEGFLVSSREQLDGLRKTPARIQLGRRIEQLELQLDLKPAR